MLMLNLGILKITLKFSFIITVFSLFVWIISKLVCHKGQTIEKNCEHENCQSQNKQEIFHVPNDSEQNVK